MTNTAITLTDGEVIVADQTPETVRARVEAADGWIEITQNGIVTRFRRSMVRSLAPAVSQ